jgi:tripartite-type tricarboxylate transporter receptor subunit TctC
LKAWSEKQPNGLSYGSTGYGLFAHLAVEEIAFRSGAKYLHIPYRGGGQAVMDMIAGRLDFGSFAAGTVLPFIKQQKIKVIAAVQPSRSALAPDVQTVDEQGISNVDASLPFLLFAPSGTPKAVVKRLSTEFAEAAANSEIEAKLFELGFEPLQVGPKEGAVLMKNTGQYWAPIITRLNIKID